MNNNTGQDTNGKKEEPDKYTIADLKGIQGLAVAGFVFLLIMGAITED